MLWSNVNRLISKAIQNWPVKVLSIALAIALVTVYRTTMISSRTLTVPLTVETGLALIPASDFPTNVRVTVRGEGDGVRSIAEGDITAYVDLSRHENEGFYSAPIRIRRRGAALEVEPLEILVNPLEVSLRLERRISVSLPIVAPVYGSVAPGFDLISHSLAPSEVSVSGPVSILETLSEVATSPVNLEGRSGDFSVAVGIVNPNPLVSMMGTGIAEFRGVVRQAVPVRSIGDLPILLSSLSDDLVSDFGEQTGRVRIEGGREQIDGFIPPPDFLSVDASSITEPGTYVLPVAAILPPGFTMIMQDPESITITFSLEAGESEQ